MAYVLPLVEVQPRYTIKWKPLPANFDLPDDPVENLKHPFLAAALTEALEIAGFVKPQMLIATNFGLCAEVDGATIVKAPDWVYVPSVLPVPKGQIQKSYTPHLEGDIPAVVMEFLSDTKGEEYNTEYQKRPKPACGKWFFYEQVLQIPWYVIFNPQNGDLEIYELKAGAYRPRPVRHQRGWLAPLNLYLGAWDGAKFEGNETGYWLRWWDKMGCSLRWGTEQKAYEQQLTRMERQRADQAEQLAEEERQRADQAEQLAEEERQRAVQAEQRAQMMTEELACLKALLANKEL